MGANEIESKKIIYFLDFPSDIGGSNKVLLTQAYIMRQRRSEEHTSELQSP